jgi:hypothetical protein
MKIETYKTIDLNYNKDDGLVYFNFEGVERKVKYCFEAYRIIDEPIFEDCKLEGYFVDGTFNDYIGTAKAKRKDIKSKKPEWFYKGKYDIEYKKPNWGDGGKVFVKSAGNDNVYKEFLAQKENVEQEERKLKTIIEKLI